MLSLVAVNCAIVVSLSSFQYMCIVGNLALMCSKFGVVFLYRGLSSLHLCSVSMYMYISVPKLSSPHFAEGFIWWSLERPMACAAGSNTCLCSSSSGGALFVQSNHASTQLFISGLSLSIGCHTSIERRLTP